MIQKFDHATTKYGVPIWRVVRARCLRPFADFYKERDKQSCKPSALALGYRDPAQFPPQCDGHEYGKCHAWANPRLSNKSAHTTGPSGFYDARVHARQAEHPGWSKKQLNPVD